MSNFIIFIILLIIVLFIKSFKTKKKKTPKLNYYKNYQFKKTNEINNNQEDLYNTVRTKEKRKPINLKEKGSLYEEHISNIYKSRNYNIAEHGKDNGIKDYGIDIIAKKENEILFIQCKNWSLNNKYRINVKEIQYTRMNVRDYLERNIMFKNYNWKIIYATSEDILDYGAKCKIKENLHEIEHKIIKI